MVGSDLIPGKGTRIPEGKVWPKKPPQPTNQPKQQKPLNGFHFTLVVLKNKVIFLMKNSQQCRTKGRSGETGFSQKRKRLERHQAISLPSVFISSNFKEQAGLLL